MASRGYSTRMRGNLRMPMRHVGGVKAPSFGINKKVTGLASTNRDEGTVGTGGVEVGGLPAGKSLARPGRKAFKHGGKVDGDHFSYGGMRERTAAERMKDWDKPIPTHTTSFAQNPHSRLHKAGGGAVIDHDGREAGTKKHHASGKQMVGQSHSTPESPLPRPLPKGRGRPAVEQILPEGADSDRGQYKHGGHVDAHHDDDDDDAQHAKSGGGKWISGAIKHPGALHRALHVPAGEKIPAKKLAKASHSDNPHMKQMVGLAKTLKGFHHD